MRCLKLQSVFILRFWELIAPEGPEDISRWCNHRTKPIKHACPGGTQDIDLILRPSGARGMVSNESR